MLLVLAFSYVKKKKKRPQNLHRVAMRVEGDNRYMAVCGLYQVLKNINSYLNINSSPTDTL